jgi:hypothetical protein
VRARCRCRDLSTVDCELSTVNVGPSSRFCYFVLYVVFDGSQQGEERLTVEFELRDIVLDILGDLIDPHEERKLTLAKGIDQFVIIAGDSENRFTIRYQLHARQLCIHIPCTSEIVPCTSNTLNGQTVVEHALHDPKSDEVAKTVDASPTRATVGGLDGRFDQADLVPVSKLMRCTRCQLARLCCSEPFQKLLPLPRDTGDVKLPVPIFLPAGTPMWWGLPS